MDSLQRLGVCFLLCAAARAAEPDAAQLAQQVAQLQSDIAKLQEQVAKLDRADGMATKAGGSDWTIGVPLALSGEGALAFFDTGSKGAFPNNEFRVDEARLFLDARLAETIFLYTELNFYERENGDTEARVGEFYLEFAGLGEATLGDWAPTVRAGRLQIPFGEEYALRYAKDDPLISHSLSDLWGVDEGVSLFGAQGAFDYVVAVQNGGYEKIMDGDPDKSVAARIGWTQGRLRLSASAMRTGDISIEHDGCAEMWFGNAYLASLGNPSNTTTFSANLAELDARWSWKGGSVGLFGGGVFYRDDDTGAGGDREAWYGSAELVQDLNPRWYGAGRYSWIRSGDGYLVQGQGAYDPNVATALADEVWRLSLGLGCRVNQHVTLKGEYSWERGDATSGAKIQDRDQVAAQAVYAF